MKQPLNSCHLIDRWTIDLQLKLQVKLAISETVSINLVGTTTSTPSTSNQEVELMTQSILEDIKEIPPTAMELDTDPWKRKEHIASEDTNELPNVTPTKKLW